MFVTNEEFEGFIQFDVNRIFVPAMVEPNMDRLKDVARLCDMDTLEWSAQRLEEKLRFELRVIRQERQNIIPTVAFQKIISNGGRLPKSVAKQVELVSSGN